MKKSVKWSLLVLVFFTILVRAIVSSNEESNSSISLPNSEDKEVASSPKVKELKQKITEIVEEEKQEEVAVEQVEPHIPGITSADIKLNFENLGFECESTTGSDSLIEWTCKEESSSYLRMVSYLGSSVSKIFYVKGTALSYDSKLSGANKAFLSYLASLPFDNAQPEKTKQWVLDSDENSEITIGDVKQQLFFAGTSGTLTMAHKDSNLD